MICPKCKHEFANLGGHKCKVVTDMEELKKIWKVQSKIIALGEMENPDTQCGVYLSGTRDNFENHVGFASLIMAPPLNDLNYVKMQNRASEPYEAEAETITASWEQFTQALSPYSDEYKKQLRYHVDRRLTHTQCNICGSRGVPGINGGGGRMGSQFTCCVGCMLTAITFMRTKDEER